MSMPDPFQHFLGVAQSSSALELLNIDQDTLDSLQIEEALRERLAMIYNHADGRGEDAELVRQRLRDAAQELKASVARRPAANERGMSEAIAASVANRRRRRTTPTLFKLTAFDRLVLSVLVGCGGWNARCRARLVALAASYGVTVQGLLRVVKGLGEHARSGGPRFGVTDIAATTMTSSAPGAPLGKPLLDRAAENLAIELRRGGPWMTIRMAALFAGLTLLAAIITLRLVLASEQRHTQNQATQAARDSVRARQTTSRAISQPVQPDKPGKSRLATFPSAPTFLGNGLPPQAVAAEAQCADMPAQLDEITRKLSITAEPSEAVYRHWDVSIETISAAWVLVDHSTQRAIERAILEALREGGDTPSVSDRLLQSIMPPQSVAQPLDLWRGAWSAGMLSMIGTSKSLPPVVVERARAQFEATLATKFAMSLDFKSSAREWLDAQLNQLVSSIEIDDNAYDAWELWISAQRALGRDDRYDRSLMQAIELVLLTGTDLSRPGPSSNVLGRLLSLALDNPTPIVAQRVQSFFDSEKISSHDLWVLTSLLAISEKASWFSDSLVLPDDADQRHRWRVRDDLFAAWPNAQPAQGDTAVTAVNLSINRDLAAQWSALVNDKLAEPSQPEPEKLVKQIVLASRLIEAAVAIENQSDDEARRILRELEDSPATTQPAQTSGNTVPVAAPPGVSNPASANPPRVGQPLGRDGEWAAAYQQVARNLEQRLELLRSLRNVAGTDLGSIDADRFVQELYRGSPPDIRLVAQSILIERFSTGPNVSMELLDQLPGAPITESLSQTIQDLCGEALPRIRATQWSVQARLALVRHVLRLRPGAATNALEVETDLLIESYVERLRLMRRERIASVAPANPQEAAKLIAQAWSDRAALVATPAKPFPDTLAGLQRRRSIRMHLAEGPIQTFAVHQLSILDLLAFVTFAEQPDLAESMTELIERSLTDRVRLASSLEQCVNIERTIVRLWQLRFGAGEPRQEALRP